MKENKLFVSTVSNETSTLSCIDFLVSELPDKSIHDIVSHSWLVNAKRNKSLPVKINAASLQQNNGVSISGNRVTASYPTKQLNYFVSLETFILPKAFISIGLFDSLQADGGVGSSRWELAHKRLITSNTSLDSKRTEKNTIVYSII